MGEHNDDAEEATCAHLTRLTKKCHYSSTYWPHAECIAGCDDMLKQSHPTLPSKSTLLHKAYQDANDLPVACDQHQSLAIRRLHQCHEFLHPLVDLFLHAATRRLHRCLAPMSLVPQMLWCTFEFK